MAALKIIGACSEGHLLGRELPDPGPDLKLKGNPAGPLSKASLKQQSLSHKTLTTLIATLSYSGCTPRSLEQIGLCKYFFEKWVAPPFMDK